MTDEVDIAIECADCGELTLESEPGEAYPLPDGRILCRECAVRRGGAWDEAEERWRVEPAVDDLLESAPPM